VILGNSRARFGTGAPAVDLHVPESRAAISVIYLCTPTQYCVASAHAASIFLIALRGAA
jgi:hypothetical protein